MRLAVVGDPVEHSQSPTLHTAALRAVGLTGTYTTIRAGKDDMPQIVEQLRDGELDGLNVTMPNKHAAADLADVATGLVHRMGAANTLARVGRRIVAHNTDVAGVRHAWRVGELPSDAPVLVLGAGGAAAAALLACDGPPVAISSRHPQRASQLVDRLGVVATQMPWGEALPGAVVVNATPLGMSGESLPEAVIDAASGLLDMTYGHGTSPSVTAARSRSIPAVDGLPMLIGQALASFRIWTGRDPGADVMTDALAAVAESSSS